jgi:hypothetical protein
VDWQPQNWQIDGDWQQQDWQEGDALPAASSELASAAVKTKKIKLIRCKYVHYEQGISVKDTILLKISFDELFLRREKKR